jgi:hypothetical protein
MLTPTWASAMTYYVDCGDTSSAGTGSLQAPLSTIAAVNALLLHPGDSLLFKRGSACNGELHPQGSGTETAPIRIAAYGNGSLPRVVAARQDAATLRLSNQQFLEIQSLDLSGGTTYGVLVETSDGTMHHLYLRDLRVHDVRGPLHHKESGLVVIHATGDHSDFDDVDLDGIQAFDTTLWSGIFLADASHVQIRNSVVHDVQGDGIVVFRSHDAVISGSLAWHTGMQHQMTIGTPNAIWTWHCTDCSVEDNEAFLTDSPGIDGGAFDIDFGNTRNSVQRNFGHDTAGYCVSVFGAFGPTTESLVAGNLCLKNGMSSRLAQRQGAILLMTWQGGSLDGVDIRDNLIDWRPPGDTPAIQSGTDLQASRVLLQDNDVWSTGISFIDPELKYRGDRNHYTVDTPIEISEGRRRMSLLPETGSILRPAIQPDHRTGAVFGHVPAPGPWRLVATLPSKSSGAGEVERAMLIQLQSAALQFGHAGLAVSLSCKPPIAELAEDWSLPSSGVLIEPQRKPADNKFSVKLIAPDGNVVHEWTTYPGPVDLGLALRQHVGEPNYSFLPLEDVRATD